MSTKIAPINNAINIIANSLSAGVFKSYDKNGNEVKDDKLVALLNKPNPHQNKEEFINSFVRNLIAGGYVYIEPKSDINGYQRRLDRLGEKGSPQLYCLNTDYICFNYKDINRFSYDDGNIKRENVSVDTIIPFFDMFQDTCNINKGVSRLCSLKHQINSYYKAQKAKGHKIDSSGHFIVHPSVKSAMGSQFGVALDDALDEMKPDYTQRKYLEDKLQNGGYLNNKSVSIMNTEVGVVNLAESIQNYSYDDEVQEDIAIMYATLGIKKEMTNMSDSSAKYENFQQAERSFYEKTIFPIAKNFCESIAEYYEWENEIKMDFTHLSFYDSIRRNESLNNKDYIEQIIMLKAQEILSVEECKKLLPENFKNNL